MKVNNRINGIARAEWQRCQDVTLQDGILYCSLAHETYDLMTTGYKADLHIRFANANRDSDLIAFFRSWGPLSMTGQTRSGVASFPLIDARTFQRWLRAILDLLTAFKQAEDERVALQEFVEAEYQYSGCDEMRSDMPYSSALCSLKDTFGISGNIVDWIKHANLQLVRDATDLLIPFAQVHPLLVHLVCRRLRNGRHVEARWEFFDLKDALCWMVLNDQVTQHHTIACCQECREVFRVGSAHARKYCSHVCGHRSTARDWGRKKRAEQRARRK